MIKYIDEIDIGRKRVFIRLDLDLPLDDSGNIADDHRLKAALSTIKYACDAGASVVLAGHMGRPKGKQMAELSMKPVFERLQQLIENKVSFASEVVGNETLAKANELCAGEVLLLENLRFEAGEEGNNAGFAEQLAGLADVYINNAFATAHRAHASTAGMVPFFEQKAAGLTVKAELEFFNRALSSPKRPLAVVFGGAKVSTKLTAIREVAKKANAILVGGAMANTFFAAQNHQVGKSLYEQDQLAIALQTIEELSKSNCELILPVDVLIADEFRGSIPTHIVPIDAIPSDKMALDIGPASLELFSSKLASANTIVWNGPMGAFEIDEYSAGTYGIVDALVNSEGLTVVGGGDTDLALSRKGAADKMSYVSTGGGAFLKLLEGSRLSAIEALED